MSLGTWKDAADIAQGFGVAGATILGVVWTGYLYFRHREQYPRASIEHEVDITQLGHKSVVVRLGVTIRNVGKVLIKIDEAEARVHQMLPCDPSQLVVTKKTDSELGWDQLDKIPLKNCGIELEPGEWEEIHFDFLLEDSVQKVSLYSFFSNRAKRRVGWNKTTMHCLREGKPMMQEPRLQFPTPPIPAPKPERPPAPAPSEVPAPAPERKTPFERPGTPPLQRPKKPEPDPPPATEDA